MNTAPKTARFFHFVNGDVCKLSLRAGETLHHYTFAETDEGFSSEACLFSFDGERVTLESHSRGRDCDGLVEYFSTLTCPVSHLRAGYIEPGERENIHYPAWCEVDASQRDHSAEAAGY